MAGRKVPLLPIWGVGAKNTDPSKGFVDLKNIFNNYYKKNSTFAAEIPEGHELLRTMYFALHPETGAPLQVRLLDAPDIAGREILTHR